MYQNRVSRLSHCGYMVRGVRRKSEFVKRCAATLRVLNPSKETDLKKLCAEDQAQIRQALGGGISAPYAGCLNDDCLDEDATWETSDGAMPGEPRAPMSRCARCGYPKSFGRSVNSIRDILLPAMANGRAHDSFYGDIFLGRQFQVSR